MLNRHQLTCEGNVKFDYVGGVYRVPPTIFDLLQEEGIAVDLDDRFYPYRATYDYECYFDNTSLPPRSLKVAWEARHLPLSVSVCSNVPGYEEPVCFITSGDSKQLVREMMRYLEAISDEAYR